MIAMASLDSCVYLIAEEVKEVLHDSAIFSIDRNPGSVFLIMGVIKKFGIKRPDANNQLLVS